MSADDASPSYDKASASDANADMGGQANAKKVK